MSARPAKAGLTLYLLHFEPAYGQAGHYLGIARSDRLEVRFLEHGRLEGSRLTAAALRAGCKALIVGLWPGASFEQEQAWKKRSHLRERCPLCNPALRGDDSPCYPAIVANQPANTGWTATAWRQSSPKSGRLPGR